MLKDVLISLVSRQVDAEGESNEISLTTAGKYYVKAGYRYVTYKETQLTGMEGTTTLLQIGLDQVSVIRTGSVEAKQVYIAGKRCAGDYITPYGTFKIAIIPWVVEAVIQEGEGRIRLEYDLEIDGRPCSRNSLVMEVKRLEAGD